MSYTATSWASTTLISARLLRHAEEQYDEAKSYLDAHNHDSRYFTETEADNKFFHLSGGDTLPAGLDADMIDGQHATDLMGSALPVGSIVVWYGTDANVPSGWAICNGGSGTPDLRNRFVVGAGSSYNVADTGGNISVTPDGSISIAPHAVTVNEMPPHYHPYADKYDGSTTNSGYNSNYLDGPYNPSGAEDQDNQTGPVGADTAHGHPGSTYTAGGPVENRPPYYALYYIQRVS